MSNLSEKKLITIDAVEKLGSIKRLGLLKSENSLDHVSWSAMTYFILGYRNSSLSEKEKAHLAIMANQTGLSVDLFVDSMSKRIESGTIMATGMLVGVNVALDEISNAKTPEEVDSAFLHYTSYLNFF